MYIRGMDASGAISHIKNGMAKILMKAKIDVVIVITLLKKRYFMNKK